MAYRAAVLGLVIGATAVGQAAAATVPQRWVAGVNLTSWSSDGYAHARPALEAARAAGVRSVTLVPTLYVDDATDSSVAPDPTRTPTDESLVRAAADAHALGLAVVIKPHVDALDGTFRGDLEPTDRAAWFSSYDRWIAHYANLATQVGATTFVVGTELHSLLDDTAGFDQVIATARARFSGTLTYAANWDAVDHVPFWDQLDVIGVDAYVPLAPPDGAPPLDLVAAWRPYQERLAALHQRTGKPVSFTELGYQSRQGALSAPFGASGMADPLVQARAYAAAFSAWSRVPWFRGISWWDWRADGTSGADDYSPRGKPAELVLRQWTAPPAPTSVGDAGGPWRLVLALVLSALAAVAMIAAGTRIARGPRHPRAQLVHCHAALACQAAVRTLLEQARTTLDSARVVLLLRDTYDPRSVHVAMGIGVPADFVGTILSSDEGLAGHVLITGNPIAVANYAEMPWRIDHACAHGVQAALAVPVRLHGSVIGVLSVVRDEAYAPSERHLLAREADRIALALPSRPSTALGTTTTVPLDTAAGAQSSKA